MEFPPLLLTAFGIFLLGCRTEGAGGALTRQASAEERADRDSYAQANRAESAALRRLWTGKDFNFYASSPSPDGRHVTEIDWSTGDLAVRDLASGALHRITAKGDWTKSGDYAMGSVFSPAGNEIAYIWWHEAAQRHELRAVHFEVDVNGIPRGTRPRVVYSMAGMHAAAILGWARDGWLLTVLARPDRTKTLSLISADNGEPRVLQSFDWRSPGAARSPDGQTIAYDFPADPDKPGRDVWLLSMDGQQRVAAVTGTTDDRVLGWLPDGSALLFARRLPGGSAVYRLPVSHGEPAGAPEQIHAGLPGVIEPLGMTADALLFGVVVESPQFRVARLEDLRAGRSDNAMIVDDPYGASIRAWDWSADGNYFVHDARGVRGSSDFRVTVRSLEGELVRSVPLDGRAEFLRWAPDGRTILLLSWDASNRPGLRTLDLKSGHLRTIRQFQYEWQPMGGDFAMSADGRYLYYRLHERGAGVRLPTRGTIQRLDLETGAEQAFQAVRWGGSMAISPDGSRLAFVDFNPDAGRFVIRSAALAGGEPREIFRQERGRRINCLNWTDDGATLLFKSFSPSGDDPFLLEVPAAGGPAKPPVDVPMISCQAEPRLHPDGDRIAYRSGQSRGEIWALDGILRAASTNQQPRTGR